MFRPRLPSLLLLPIVTLPLLLVIMYFQSTIVTVLTFTDVIVGGRKQRTVKVSSESRDGVIILGMHRSGTSMLAGLLVRMGLQTGGPLLPPAKDNKRGFFERYDLVSQNTILMQLQHVQYAFNTQYYDPIKGLDLARSNSSLFDRGRQMLEFLKDPLNHPYLLKDPRLCITLPTWLPLLNNPPAILFIYRHPFDVALSLHKREQEHSHFPIVRGLRLWYVYNRKAIQQSQSLCRVVTSYDRVVSSTKREMNRIYNELRTSCGVSVPHQITEEDVNYFVDPSLQQKSPKLGIDFCDQHTNTTVPPIAWPEPSASEIEVYLRMISTFCAMEKGEAFLSTFEWDNDMSDA